MHRLILGLVLGLGFCFYYFAEPVRNPLLGGFPSALLAAPLMLFFYLVMKVYCAQWRELSGQSTALSFFESVAVPILSLTWPVLLLAGGKRAELIIELQMTHLLMILGLLGLLADFGRTVRAHISSEGILGFKSVVRGQNQVRGGFLFLNTPPQSRLDLLPSDLLIAAGYIIPVIFILS